MTGLYLHRDELKLLGYAGLGLLFLFTLVTAWPAALLMRFFDFASGRMPERTKEDKQANAKFFKVHKHLLAQIFNVVAAVLLTYFAVNLFLPDEWRYRMSDDWSRPMLAIGFLAATLMVYAGALSFAGRRGWQKWTFWVSTISTLLIVTPFSHWLRPRSGGALMTVWVLGLAVYMFMFGTLEHIDITAEPQTTDQQPAADIPKQEPAGKRHQHRHHHHD